MNLAIYNFTDNTYKYDGNSRPNKKIKIECYSNGEEIYNNIGIYI